MKQVTFTEAEFKTLVEKVASLVEASNQSVREATRIGKNLLEDNEKIAVELEELREEKRAHERVENIEKIATLLLEHGMVGRKNISQRKAELEKIADDALVQLRDTLSGFSGFSPEKLAEEGTMDSFAFLGIDLDEKPDTGGKPGLMVF